MVKHNNILPNVHLRKHWQRWVKTSFNQPGRKLRRLQARREKAQRIFPRPLQALRPVVASCTNRYAGKPRIGRGFTLDEVKEAGLSVKFARTVGISVDHRRKNRSLEAFQLNVRRLKAYREKLVLLPRGKVAKKGGKMTIGDSDKKASELVQNTSATVLPVRGVVLRQKPVKLTEAMKKFDAHGTLKLEWANQKNAGVREKRAKEQQKATN